MTVPCRGCLARTHTSGDTDLMRLPRVSPPSLCHLIRRITCYAVMYLVTAPAHRRRILVEKHVERVTIFPVPRKLGESWLRLAFPADPYGLARGPRAARVRRKHRPSSIKARRQTHQPSAGSGHGP